MKNILVTGGPVHAFLDPVKVITNRFKGGLMREFVNNLISTYKDEVKVTFLVSKLIDNKIESIDLDHCKVLFHNGFEDYRQQVLDLAPQMDAVVLGAAVANLIPAEPLKTKFPSHNYKVGDIIPINFTIAPRVIDEVKKVAPNTHLFGFKLLSGYQKEELIRAAYEVVLESKAVTVFANDTSDLMHKYAVTKERAVLDVDFNNLHEFVWQAINDTYYRTEVSSETIPDDIYLPAKHKIHTLIEKYKNKFITVEEGYVFGTVAVRCPVHSGFITTTRGKKELENVTMVRSVNTAGKIVYAAPYKASLNAPLLNMIFQQNDNVDYIVHYHEQVEGLRTYPYAYPGTVRDNRRSSDTSFNVEGHGCFLLFDKNGVQI